MSEKGLNQLGSLLRQAREQRGLSVGQVAVDTRILERYLLALEAGDYAHLPGDVYARGFIRNYAQYLGLPPEELIEIYRTERGGSAPIRIVPAAQPPRTRSCLAPSLVAVFFLVGILVVVAYLVANAAGLTRIRTFGTPTPPATMAATPQPLATLTPDPLSPTSPAQPTSDVGQPTSDPAVTAVVGLTPFPPPVTPTLEAPVVVDLRILDQASWIQIQVDGRIAREGIQQPGAAFRFTAQNQIRVRVGNAAAVEVAANGGQPGRLGNLGQVRTIIYGPQGIVQQ